MWNKWRVMIWVGVGNMLALSCSAGVSIVDQEQWADVSGGKETTFHFTIASDQAVKARAGWQLSCADRTLARQEREIAPGPGKTETLEIRVQMPEVKEGVILAALLAVTVIEAGSEKPVAAVEKKIWIYPETPFADRKEWLKKLDIRMFDPEKKTGECFEKAGIPFKQIMNIGALAEIKEGVIIVGEGVSFDDFKGLPEILFKAAARGVPVLCLAPSAGNMILPGIGESDLPVPRTMTFRRNEMIARLDKRLDAIAWPPDGAIAVNTLALRSARSAIVGEVKKGPAEWPWLEMAFNQKRGMFILCHFAIIEKWEAGPAPRFLLARIMEYLTADQPAKE